MINTLWKKQKPRNMKERRQMLKSCGKKCFLSKTKKYSTSYPICIRKTCRVSKLGVRSAYIRGKQWSSPETKPDAEQRARRLPRTLHRTVAKRAKKLLERFKKTSSVKKPNTV
tara:strand:- start:891 stop:1229 length:339 start_codon:yes stop_codon:yes gene_type:complete